MASKTSSITSENETFFSKQIKLKHKLISVTISNKHPEINIDDHKIRKSLLIFNLLLEAELNKENTKDSEDGIPDILITGFGHFPDWTFSPTDTSRLTHPRLDNSPTDISPS